MTHFPNDMNRTQAISIYESYINNCLWSIIWVIWMPQLNILLLVLSIHNTGKSLSEAFLFAEHGENMLCKKIDLNVRNNLCTQHVLPRFELGIFMYWTCNSMNNLSSYCGLVDAKICNNWFFLYYISTQIQISYLEGHLISKPMTQCKLHR